MPNTKSVAYLLQIKHFRFWIFGRQYYILPYTVKHLTLNSRYGEGVILIL